MEIVGLVPSTKAPQKWQRECGIEGRNPVHKRTSGPWVSLSLSRQCCSSLLSLTGLLLTTGLTD